ncbi:hypothetical protein C5L31_000581 [Secundilactobacillus malefermentans]|uniref:HTH marR-type domain-containing protein n=1 Tax=Secundilactobacillus malefermentans TaxID=176292 RepID=A0A4R5NRV4_9LACO|nr:MarR family transcriptional regulator [Secundilactobacillus malefermentans]KRM56719.1 transcriptional regulator [Secundilactobacillus malefermentans DSM 5705 = KCTC 3548]TDG79817.1 hypothetical protein C5L31_000581 [Secundilactobacillus malefermentans]
MADNIFKNGELLKAIGILNRCYKRDLKARLQPLGLNEGNFFLLTTVAESPGITQDQLGKATDLEHSTIARMIRRMVVRGQIERHQDETDRRIQRLYVSNDAKTLIPTINHEVRHETDSLTSQLTVDEQKQLFSLINRAIDGVKKKGE